VVPDISARLRELDFDLDPSQVDQLGRFRDRLAAASREFNLTSLRNPEQIERRHILESLAFGRLLRRQGLLNDSERVLDIGTGAGLPGLPLKIAWPWITLGLLESVGKKCRFLEEVSAAALELTGVEVIEGRAEDVAHDPAHRATYDLVVARAVAPLPVLLEYSLPFLRVGGHLAASKGSAALREIDASAAALESLGGRLYDAPVFEPPQGLRKTVALVEKVAPTPERYPRRAGIPAKRPIS
jgi:16S rRNA (guanine527-N7)-methyltransferase